MEPHPLREGTVLRGKYRVERVLGSGGMGMVVAARHLRLDQRVAIKVLTPESLRNPDLVARFAREARAAARIRSEHVVRILDVDDQEDGAPFIVMEYLEGRDLAQVIHEDGALDPARATDYVLEVCAALAEAHALGLVHRDLKPANLFLTTRADGEHAIKLLDFGISKVVDAEGAPTDLSLTNKTSMLGSPYYMSPEQIRCSKEVDGRSDIWSLGVVLYQLLSATLPFGGPTATSLAARIAADPPRPLRETRPDTPVALEVVVLRCLEKEPEKRFANVAELARALVPFASNEIAKRNAERLSQLVKAAPALAATAPLPMAPAPERRDSSRAGPAAGDRVTEALDSALSPEDAATPAPSLQRSASSTHAGQSVATSPPTTSRRRYALVAAVALAGAALTWLAVRQPSGAPTRVASPTPATSMSTSASPAASTSASPAAGTSASPAASASASASPSTATGIEAPRLDASVSAALAPAKSAPPIRPDPARRPTAPSATVRTGLDVNIK